MEGSNMVGNRHNPMAIQDEALKEIAAARDATVRVLSQDSIDTEKIVSAIARTNTALDTLRKQLQPRLWEAENSFRDNTVINTPHLSVDLPVAFTWFQVFHSSTNPSGTISFYDQDGAREKMRFSIVGTGAGPIFMPAFQGVLFRKNLSVLVSSDAPFPLYVVMQGVTI